MLWLVLITGYIYRKSLKDNCLHASLELGICSIQEENNLGYGVQNRYFITEQKPLYLR